MKHYYIQVLNRKTNSATRRTFSSSQIFVEAGRYSFAPHSNRPRQRPILPLPFEGKMNYPALRDSPGGDAMDDDKEKSIFESFADAIQNTFDKAVDVTKNAIEPERIKPGDQVVIMPMAGSSMSDPMMPPFVIIPRRKKSASKQAAKTARKKSAKKSAK
jgi:hypothetical protein